MSKGSRVAELRAVTNEAILARNGAAEQRFERILLKLDKKLVNTALLGSFEYDLKWFCVHEDDDELDHTDLSRILNHLQAQGFKISLDQIVSWKE